jgi:hypothetical protein
MFRFIVLATAVLAGCVTASASIITYSFAGSAVFVPKGAKPFGFLVQLGPVTGQVKFETDVEAAEGSTVSSASYRQLIDDGFTATFLGISLSASSYITKVADNVSQSDGSFADILSFRFASDDDPAPVRPLLVNGLQKDIGLFAINLVGSGNLFSNVQMPTQIVLAQFPKQTDLVSDQPTGNPVQFLLTSFVRVPEPSSIVLAAIFVISCKVHPQRKFGALWHLRVRRG